MSQPVNETVAHFRSDEMLLIDQYRSMKRMLHGDIQISIKDGVMVKLYTTHKVDLVRALGAMPLKEVE